MWSANCNTVQKLETDSSCVNFFRYGGYVLTRLSGCGKGMGFVLKEKEEMWGSGGGGGLCCIGTIIHIVPTMGITK